MAEHAGAEREVARLAGPEELGLIGEHPQRERVLLGGVRVALTTAHAAAVVLQQPERERVVAAVDRVGDLVAADLVPGRRVGCRIEHERARPREAVIGRQARPRVPGGQDDVAVVDRGRLLDHASATRIGRRAAKEREVDPRRRAARATGRRSSSATRSACRACPPAPAVRPPAPPRTPRWAPRRRSGRASRPRRASA